MTTSIQCDKTKSPVDNVQKLRFGSMQDFWGFVAQMAASRVHDYAKRPASL